MRRKLVLLFVVAQVLVLAFMAGKREFIVHAGERIHLRTAPVDPRDLFRGDLNYEVSSVGPKLMRDGVSEHLGEKGYKVYAVLTRGEEGLFRLDHLTDRQPQSGIFMRGRITGDWRFRRNPTSAAVKYGIEQLFVEQGTGRDIERRRGRRDDLQIPMEVEVAVGGGGTAVIRGYRWSKLGVKLELLRFNRRNRNTPAEGLDEPLSPKLRVTLKNVSDEPLSIVDPGDHCGFELVTAGWVVRSYTMVDEACRNVPVDRDDLVRLSPEETYSVELDLSEPRWFVKVDGETGEIGELAELDAFRIVYQAPPGAEKLDATPGGRLWTGDLPTRAFNAFAILD